MRDYTSLPDPVDRDRVIAEHDADPAPETADAALREITVVLQHTGG